MEYGQKLKMLSEWLGMDSDLVLELGLDCLMSEVIDNEWQKGVDEKMLEEVEKNFKNNDK